MGKTKKSTYIDLILLECSNLFSTRENSTTSAWLGSLFGAPGSQQPVVNEFKPTVFATAKLENQVRIFSTVNEDTNPTWNEDATFTYEYVHDRELIIYFQVFEQTPNWYGGSNEVLLCSTSIRVADIPFNTIHDLYLDLHPRVRPPNLHPNASLPSMKMHVLFSKSSSIKDGMLKYLGIPQISVPIRMDIGDIILFSNSNWVTHGVKLTTYSRWDHVAIVVRMQGKKHLRLFDATSDGVNLYKLDASLRNCLEGSTLGIRRLRIERSSEIQQSLEEFVKEVEGRPYKNNIWDLVKAGFGTHVQDDLSSMFCSQLIAECYKRIKIIPEKTTSSNFLPSHFDEKNIASANELDSLLRGKLSKSIIFPRYNRLSESQKPILSLKCDNDENYNTPTCINIISILWRLIDPTSSTPTLTFIYMTEVIYAKENIILYRNYEHFQQLDSELRKCFKNVPKLPPPIVIRKTKKNIIELHRKAMQIYIDIFANDSTSRSAFPLLDFCSPELSINEDVQLYSNNLSLLLLPISSSLPKKKSRKNLLKQETDGDIKIAESVQMSESVHIVNADNNDNDNNNDNNNIRNDYNYYLEGNNCDNNDNNVSDCKM